MHNADLGLAWRGPKRNTRGPGPNLASHRGPVAMGRHEILIVRRIHGIAQILLLLVGHTASGVGLHLRLGEGRQEHSRQNRDDGNDDQQLDEREGTA